MNQMNQIRTIGMKIDSVIATIDSIPHTYQAFVIVCCLFAFILLNSNPPSPTTVTTTGRNTAAASNSKHKQASSSLASNACVVQKSTAPSCSSSSSSSSSSTEPQPKWHILKLLNILAVFGLTASFLYFCNNASDYINDSNAMLKFTAVWSAFLCYFFGFFGISFIDDDELQRGMVDVDVNVNVNGVSNNDSLMNKPLRPLHPPAACTPVCSDPPSTSTSKPKSTQSASSASVPASEDIQSLTNEEIVSLVLSNKIKDHRLEKLTDPDRAVVIRREVYSHKLSTLPTNANNENATNTFQSPIDSLPHLHSLNYSKVYGANCETVIGYIPLPVGIVGPITLNNQSTYFPMATTEGCLVASTNRGCKAITEGGGATSVITRDGITRAPCVRMNSAKDAAHLKLWCEERDNFLQLKAAFESTTSFGKLDNVSVSIAGRNAYIRLRCFSGDAMGMNMVSKGSLAVIDYLKTKFPSMVLLALSGNVCTDKKAAAMNWIEGRGKSVVVEAIIPKDVVRKTLKTDVKTMVSVNINKNLIGSAVAGVVGGFNAHASNIVSAVFLATGQDPAQNVESSNCMTLIEETENGDLWISCTMPSIEVGTVGGGTGLKAQAACLGIVGCKGGGEVPGANAKKLAHVVAAAVMAGELSLLAALAANTLVQAHMTHNRKPASK